MVVILVIPLSLLFAFILIDIEHISANLISLGAIDFGIIVDSAVVLVEAIMVKVTMTVANAPCGMESVRLIGPTRDP